MLVRDDDLVVRLSWWERLLARHGDLRVPLDGVSRVIVEPDWWRALRGAAGRGVWVPGVLCLGVRGHHGGRDFVAVRPGRPVVCVVVWPPADYALLAVSVPAGDAEAVAARVCRSAPRVDLSTRARPVLPVPEETVPLKELPRNG
ncbi:hypothetical protein [Streptomyces sp. NPDC047028]|uniref:hypothetical protein n=1 Tax=Streptomyces sp. NPDC047028 TaxID=3155793 RepID=UPI0033E2BA5F